MTQSALVAMSGGVDSSVAAYLTLQKGYACAGAMMRLCGGETDSADARAVAERLGIPFIEFDFTEIFAKAVLGPFAAAYAGGRTPNPCVLCNRFLKFGALLDKAREMGLDAIATGHYARVTYDSGSGRWLLRKGADAEKDQSYVLYSLSQEQLGRALLPLGELRKDEVREIAQAQGFGNAEKGESQDICFVPDGDYAAFIERYTGKICSPGRFVDSAGNALGEHKGLIRYTVGQRRGFGLSAAERRYVLETRPTDNTVVLGPERELYTDTLTAKEINLIACDRIDGALRVKAKARYRQREQGATVTQPDEHTLRLRFDTPQRAVTKGQAVVLYDGDVILGGGTIV
ncbi:MAG: tRNA 2-thiouridine(34) synthase MnmA [Firmicutes bacterium]|nr:tRNA 2-thiouridine(34) synthase MnmA [Bacillota bacterium]